MNWFRTFCPAFSLVMTLAGSFASAAPSAEQMKQLKLPKGFSISVFAEAPNARQMALSPSGTLYIGTRTAGDVYAIPNALVKAALKPGAAPVPVLKIASGLTMPNGVAFHDGTLYVAAVSEVIKFPEIEKSFSENSLKPGTIKQEIIRKDYPTETHHGWKYIAIGPDGWMYIPVGAPCNICKSKDEIFATMTRMSLDGKKREIYAHGLRNSVGFDWHPKTKELWFTENGRDMMGDDVPGDELNYAPKAGMHFGYPFCHERGINDPELGKGKDCSEKGPYARPAFRLAPHTAALGIKFYRGKQFPSAFQNRVLIAEHGSWNRSKKIGYRVMSMDIDADGKKASNYQVFIEGWKDGEKAWGRPVDLLELPDGSMFLSDDEAGVIYKISYAS